MNRVMKRPSFFAAVLAACVLTGCVRSLHPIYTSSDVIFKEDLIGTWRQSGETTTWQFTELEDDKRDRAYRLVLTDGEGHPGTFLAHLVQLENKLMLDLFPIAPQAGNNDFYEFHFQRVHTFLHVEFDGETLTLSAMNPKWLNDYLKRDPDAVAHAIVTPSGHMPTGEKGNVAAERLMLTAKTRELQRFVLKHVDTKDAFGNPVDLKKFGD